MFVAPFPPPYGGVASFVVSMINGLPKFGINNIIVVSFGDSDLIETYNEATVYRVKLSSKHNLLKLFYIRNWVKIIKSIWVLKSGKLGFYGTVKEILKTIVLNEIAEKHNSNIVAFNQTNLSICLIACRKLWKKKIGVALTVYGEVYDTSVFIKERISFIREVIYSPDIVMASSSHCAMSFKSVGINRDISVNYIGVDIDRMSDDGSKRLKYRQELGINETTKLVVFVGRFNPEMGLDKLIEIIPNILSEFNDVKFLLVGASGELTLSAQKLKDDFKDQVFVINDVPFDLLPFIYAASDIILAPSRAQHACMGVSIKEAMAASKPVIGSSSGGIPEAIVDNETGLIVNLDESGNINKKQFKEAILSLLNNKKRAIEMGNRGRVRAIELFSELASVKTLIKYFKVVQKKISQ
jgi:glycosyltransferase involved in cell wall biosynthesis